MFGIGSSKRLVSITGFKRGGDASYIHSHLEDRMTKKEMLKMVGEWWDNYHTGFNDYDGIQVMFPFEKEETMFELKKCPFCGGKAVIRNPNFPFMVTIACQDCGAEIRVISEENAVEKAVEKWNRRAGGNANGEARQGN